jgi:hypothetical protein
MGISSRPKARSIRLASQKPINPQHARRINSWKSGYDVAEAEKVEIPGASTPTTVTKYSGIEKTTRKTRVAWAIGISRLSAPASSPAITMIPRPPGVLEK